MADYDPSLDPLTAYFGGQDTASKDVSIGDDAKAALSGALDVGKQGFSLARAGADATGYDAASKFAKLMQDISGIGADAVTGSMSDEAKKRLSASITSPEFWEHPLSAATLKAANMAPGVAASIAPALLTDGMLAPFLVAGTGAAMGAGQSTDDTYSQTDSMSDAEFRKAMPYYAGLRDMGMDEDDARAQANAKLMGLKPALNAIVGGAAMLLGPGGRAAGLIPEEAGAGLLKRAGIGAAEGGLGGAAMGATGEGTREDTQIQLDQRTQLDPALILAAGADSGLTMAAMGAVGGAMTRGHATLKTEGLKAEVTPEIGPDSTQDAALKPAGETAPSPVPEEPAPVTPPVSEPTAEITPPAAPVEAPEVTTPEPSVSADNAPSETPEVTTPIPVAPAPRVLRAEPTPEADPVTEPSAGVLPESGNTPKPTVLPDEVTAKIDERLKSIRAAAQRLEDTGVPVKGGVDAFVAAKRADMEKQAWEQIGTNSAPEVPTPRRASNPPKNKGKNWGKELDRRVANGELATKTVERFTPTEAEDNYRALGLQGSAGRKAIFDRAKRMVADAEEKGVTIPKRIKDSTNKTAEHPASTVLLTEAKSLIAPRKRGATLEDYDRFLTREKFLRSGKEEDRTQVVSERRAEGEQKMKARVTKGPGAEAVEAEPNVEQKLAAEEPAVDTSDEASEMEPVDMQEPRQEAGQERDKVTLKGNEVVAGKDKTGTFKVEQKKVRSRPVTKSNAEDTPAGWDSVDGKTEETVRAEKLQKTISKMSAHDVAGHLAETAVRPTDRIIAARVQRMMTKLSLAGMKFGFHVIHPGDMVHPNMLRSKGMSHIQNAPDGPRADVYVNGHDMGRISGMNETVVLHELIHSVTQGAINLGKVHGPAAGPIGQLKKDLTQLGNNVVRALNKKIARYKSGDLDALNEFEKAIHEGTNNALRNEHELVAWGLTDPRMQDFLESIPYKNETGWSRFVGMIRTFLDMKEESQTALSELLRISDDLLDHDAHLVTNNWASLFDPTTNVKMSAQHVGDFSPAANAANTKDINDLFRDSMGKAMSRVASRSQEGAKEMIGKVTDPAKAMASAVQTAEGLGRVGGKLLNAVTTNDQYRQKVEKLIPNAKTITDTVEKTGVIATKLKEEGVDLTAAVARAQKQNPKVFEMWAKLIHEQTMHGVNAAHELGEGDNAHLTLSRELEKKLEKGTPLTDLEHDAAMADWQARRQHPAMKTLYKAITREVPEFAPLQARLFKFYKDAQSEMMRGQIGSILEKYEFKGTDAEKADVSSKIYNDRWTPEFREKLGGHVGKSAASQLEATKALKVVNGPYAPLMRRGEHAVIGEYKIAEPTNGKKIDGNTWEFNSRKEAYDFASKIGLHATPKSVYYDSATGERSGKLEALSTEGDAVQKYQVKLQRQHLEFHEKLQDAKDALAAHKESGLFDKLGLEERRHIESETSQFSDRGVESLLRSLSAQEKYQQMSDADKETMRASIKEAGLRAMTDNRVQSRRLPRRHVQGASDDVARNLYDYNNSQANFRAKMETRPTLDAALKEMWDHVQGHRYSVENEARSKAANELERRVRAQDPNEYSGNYTDWSRRLGTWSYIDRMARASHLILHQTHLPMITAPYLAGRHGLVKTYSTVLRTWKEFNSAYGHGGRDFLASISDSLHKGTDYAEALKSAVKGGDKARVGKMFDALNEIGLIHPQAGIEVAKYLPSKELGGMLGALDGGMSKIDTIFRHLTNATEAINRFVGATAAYRMEFEKLTRAGKTEAQAHEAAVEYARQTISDTQGLYSSTNQAPIFKNKWLKPFLQFKQFPQMMYHLLTKLAVTALKGEDRATKVQAMKSLAGILGMHMMMAGAIQGLPLEAFKLLGFISKGLGLTDGDWSDVEHAVMRKSQDTFGKSVSDVLMHGVGAQLGVDVHHRLGLNSFVTFGMPDQLDSKNISEFVLNAVGGAPLGLVSDTLKGTHKMLSGDIEGGALQAFPLQALRDAHTAIAGGTTAGGYDLTVGDRVKQGLGFTSASKAQHQEQQSAVYNAVTEYNTERAAQTKQWLSAKPEDREEAWSKIQSWNEGKPPAAQIKKGELYKALLSRAKSTAKGNMIDNVRLNKSNRDIAKATADLY